MDTFKREDYIYLRFLSDDEEKYRKKGDIVRYRKEWLLHEMKNRRFNTCFSNDTLSLVWEKNDDVDENDIMFDKVYKSISLTKDLCGTIYLWEDDYLYLDNWLFSHLDENGIDLINNIENEVIPDSSNSNKLIKLKEGCPDIDARIHMYFNKRELIDFKIPGVAALFYNPYWIDLFSRTEIITDEEKQQLFQEDFSNAIFVNSIEDSYYPAIGFKKEHHYFKIRDNIKVKTSEELEKYLGVNYSSSYVDYVKDNDGFISHICSHTGINEYHDRDIEQNILKIADRISSEEALIIHKKACSDYIKKRKEEDEIILKKFKEEQKALEKQYQKVKNNPEMFPGVNGDFIHVDKSKNIEEQKYTLDQVKNFYKKLKTLDSEIVKHICFYGGTIPYILCNKSNSRDFGDIDMFVPTEYMEKLREELSKQESFKMICDSKPYAVSCLLTTRIPKEVSEVPVTNKDNDVNQSLFEIFSNFISLNKNKKNYIDENGIVHDTRNINKEASLPYYRKVQDFGFKAKLFGINISVFPIYEYDNNIMAKSFNVNKDHKFLLGVKVLNNTKIEEFIKKVNIYDSILNILPLEYTLASKQSAINEKYLFRCEKDKQDIEYILSHKKELGISEDLLEKVLLNYPDYSISIAYEVLGDQTVTMDGESYKELVLTNRHLS